MVDDALARSHPLEQREEYCYDVGVVSVVDGQRYAAAPICVAQATVMPLSTPPHLVRVPAHSCNVGPESSANVWFEVTYEDDPPFEDDYVEDAENEKRDGCSIVGRSAGWGAWASSLLLLALGGRRSDHG